MALIYSIKMGDNLYQKTTLPNGLRLVTATMPHTRSVAIGFFVGVGSRYETDTQAGISHFIEHMCFKGTDRRRTPTEISAAIEGVGGMLNAGTDKEMTIYWCKVAQSHFHLALDVIVDMLAGSRFDPVDIDKERQVIIEEIKMSKDTPSQEVNLIIDELLWPDHPLGKDTAGTQETVTGTDRNMLLDYMTRMYTPTNMVVSIAGNIEHETVLEAIKNAFDGWNGREKAPLYLPFKESRNPRIRVEKRDIEQAHVCMGLPGLSIADPRRFTVDLLNVVLGEGMSSRLFTEIRENLGLAYNIYSYIDHFLDSGALTICAGVEPNNLPTMVTATLGQLSKFREELVPEEEINKAKELSKGRTLLRMEDSRNVNGWFGAQEILTGKIMTVDEMVTIIDAITAEDIQRVAREIFVGERLRMAVVGPTSNTDHWENLLKI
jgi:predicted Zn-dependent peptidase